MKASIIQNLVSVLLLMLTPDVLKKVVDGMLDVVEEAVASSDSKMDDAVVLPMCSLIRATFGVPDDD